MFGLETDVDGRRGRGWGGEEEAKSRDVPALLPIWFPEQDVLCQHGSGLVVSLKRGKENG